MNKKALVVRGGWEGHQPVETTDSFLPFLRESGFEVTVSDSTSVYADAELMESIDLVVQSVTMTTIESTELAGLIAAVRSGTGLVGWHGGIVDSFRNSADYLQLVGGQFAHHAGNDPALRTGGPLDNYLPHAVTIVPERRDHPVIAGLDDFDLTTELYWVLTDSYNDVLATVTTPAREFDPWHEPVTTPAIWTRQWGEGRIVVCTMGHQLEVLDVPAVRRILEQAMGWATR